MTAGQPPQGERYQQAEVQAFTEHGKWLLGLHDKRSENLGQRATTLLGFISATTALLPAGFTFGRDAIDFTGPVQANLVLVLVALVGAASFCLRTLKVRKITVPSGTQLRDQWTHYATGGARGLVHGQIAQSLLGSDPDPETKNPLAASAAEADSRAKELRRALRCVGAAVLLTALLTAQILKQQV